LERLEEGWWRDYADLEEQFAWVQPRKLRHILRRHYLKRIVAHLDLSDLVVELGCGTGWFCRDLARAGAMRVVGLDFSAEQIRLARLRTEQEGLDHAVSFFVDDVTESKLLERMEAQTIVIHGVLHHLDQSQIAAVIDRVCRLLRKNGTLVVLEPIISAESARSAASKKLWRLLDLLQRFPEIERRRGLRRMSDAEAAVRRRFAERFVGAWPCGPSPKEKAFMPGELENHLSGRFREIVQEPVMIRSHLVVQEWLLRRISQPITSNLMMPLVALLASRLDRWLAYTRTPPSGEWVFTLFRCTV
jgi:SAM-dependent methyltransferase